MRRTLRRLAAPLAVVLVPLVAVIALQSYQAMVRAPLLARNLALTEQTFQAVAALEGLKSALQDAERGQRGYLLSGDKAYLDAYQSGVARVPLQFADARRLVEESERQAVQALSGIIDAKLAEMASTLSAYQQSGLPAAQGIVRTNTGLQAMASLEQALDDTAAAERSALAQRLAATVQTERKIAFSALATGIITLILTVMGVLLVLAAFRRERELIEHRLQSERRLGAELLRAQTALGQAQKMEALGQLTGGVAHDFNNLLHVIKNAIAIVQSRLTGGDDETVKYLEMAKRNVDRAASTTARLLAFARQQPLNPEPFNVNKLVTGMAELLRATLGESIALETVLSGGLWSVAADRNQLETALLNLAVNARDAMPLGGKLTIETGNALLDEHYVARFEGLPAGQYCLVAVSDSGAGMTAEVMAHAFEPFYTTKGPGLGTGLGLSQVYGFLKQSGGHVSLYSEPGAGTTVKLYLPRYVGEGTEAHAEPTVAAEGSGQSILVVEDNEDVRTFTAHTLTQLGYRVSVAGDGAAAMDALERLGGADLIFTDVGLPNGMSGRAVAEAAQRRWPDIKVLYTTGYARNSIIHHGRLDPGVQLITKPYTQSQLAAKVSETLGPASSNAAG